MRCLTSLSQITNEHWLWSLVQCTVFTEVLVRMVINVLWWQLSCFFLSQALAPVGAIFGCPIAGWIADHLGRKAALMLVGVPYLTGYMLIVYAHMISNATAFKIVLLVGRFLTGVGLGWSCLAGPVSSTKSPHTLFPSHSPSQHSLPCLISIKA